MNETKLEILPEGRIEKGTPPSTIESDISIIPNEILCEIFSFLDIKARAACCLVSKNWRDLNQSYLHDISIIVASLNKSIPSYIGYAYWSQDEVRKQLLKKYPDIKHLTGPSLFERLNVHTISFQGEIRNNSIQNIWSNARENGLTAVALEYDKTFSNIESKTLSEINIADFIIEIAWKGIYSDYNGNYSQDHNNESAPVLYDVHTHSTYQRESFTMNYIFISVHP
jgi:F-box-like